MVGNTTEIEKKRERRKERVCCQEAISHWDERSMEIEVEGGGEDGGGDTNVCGVGIRTKKG